MKRKFYVFALIILAVTSCGKNGLYINVANSLWEIHTETQIGFVGFLGEDCASTIQTDFTQGYTQVMNGTYTVDGHAVDIAPYVGTGNRLVRTFSHLKNSRNKNLTRLSPDAPENLEGSVWVVLEKANLHFVHFRADGKVIGGYYPNVVRQEGHSYGWNWGASSYSLSDNRLSMGTGNGGTLYHKDLLALDEFCVPCASTLKGKYSTSGALAGTVWAYQSSGYPGFIIFTSDTEFTRILVMSNVIFGTLSGTYELKGNSLVMDTEELHETCNIAGDQFVYLEKTYKLVKEF